MNAHHAVSTNTHRNIIVIIFHIKEKKINPTVHPEPPYCSGFGCKTYKDCFLTRQIHLPFSIFFLSFPSLSFFSHSFSKGEWVYSPRVNWVWPGIFFSVHMLHNLLSANFDLLPVQSNPSRAFFCRGGVPPSDSGGPREVWTERLLIIHGSSSLTI